MSNWKPHDTLLGLVMSVAAKTTKAGKSVLVKAGLGQVSFGRIGVLAALREADKTQAELSRELKQSSPSMMETLERLEKEKYLAKSPHPTDGRKEIWRLTPLGVRALERSGEILRMYGRRFDAFFEAKKISKKEIERFKEILRLLNDEFFSATGATE